MRRVILESPFAGDVEGNIDYARRCVRDSLLRGEAPIASHLLFTQPGILRDEDPVERQHGIAAGLSWLAVAEATVVYTDRGISGGMQHGIDAATAAGVPVEYRSLKAAARGLKGAKGKAPTKGEPPPAGLWHGSGESGSEPAIRSGLLGLTAAKGFEN